jgi:hypothetical protein
MGTTRLARVLAAAACGAGLLAVMAGPAAAAQNPPGNNGTVKIDGVAFDDHPNNEPHVGCVFQVDFYGFDQGDDVNAAVTFQAWPPTGDREVLLDDEVFIGEDAAGGGTDLDASATYDLTDELAGFTPHAQQGFHVRLTVHADGSQGADTKHKTFWVSGCGGSTTTSSSTTSSSTTSSSMPGGSTTSTPGGSTTSSMPGGSTTSTPGGSTTSSMPGGTTPSTADTMPGVSPSAPTTTPAGAGGALPETGSNTVPLLIGALALVALGTGGVLGARHLRGARD